VGKFMDGDGQEKPDEGNYKGDWRAKECADHIFVISGFRVLSISVEIILC